MNSFDQLPPLTKALLDFAKKERLDFDTPGHHSGSFFRMTEAGATFVDHLGSAMFTADISDSSSVIGDPSSHEGVSGEAEELAAKTWHSDRCFFILGGTSTSNRIAVNALLAEGDLVLFDRNNHKSTYQGALLQAGAIPVYLEAERNEKGIIGGLTEKSLNEETLRQKAAALCPAAAHKKRPYRLACLQLATYDGLFLNAKKIVEKLSNLCDYILFDAAWAGYENFIPLLQKSAVLTLPLHKNNPGLLVTQSVHKQLAGFSMTSQLHKKDSHIKGQSRYLPDDLLQNTYLMHISTSPYYPLLAGLEMNAHIHVTSGDVLWAKAFHLATTYKKKYLQTLRIIHPFVPPTVHGKPWESYDIDTIMKDPAFFAIDSNETWHGFSHILSDGYMTDPCKILLTTGSMKKGFPSIPAPLIAAALEKCSITAEKSDFYSLLLLVEPGDTPSKWETLLDLLQSIEEAYEKNLSLDTLDWLPTIPHLPGEGLRDFSQRYQHFLLQENALSLQQALFSESHFPPAPLTGREANQAFIKGNRKKVPLHKALGDIALESLLPYPPGIVVLAAGEQWTEEALSYFLFLEKYKKAFPAFSPEIVGVHEYEKGEPYVWCLSR